MPRNTPLVIYKQNKNSEKHSYLIKAGVEKKLKIAAWKVYYPECPTLKECPAKITLQSSQIEAAMILFMQETSNTNLMGRFRYKSTLFRMYHQNVPVLAVLHSRAIKKSTITSFKNTNIITDNKLDDDED